MRVPREDVVATSRPEGGTLSVVKEVVCATIIETGCLEGVEKDLVDRCVAGRDGGGDGRGGPGHGGKWIS